MQKQTLRKTVGLATLVTVFTFSSETSETLAAPAPLNFNDGGTDAAPNNSDVDGYPGVGGSGWVGPWSKPENFNTGGSVGAGVENASPLNAGGNYLNVDFLAGRDGEAGRAGVSRQYDNAVQDYTLPHTITFDYRVDSLPTGWDNTSDRIQIFDSTSSTSGSSSADTWGIFAIGTAWSPVGTAGKVWSALTNKTFKLTDLTPSMTVVEGTTYSFTIDVDPANNQYDVSVFDGTNTATATNADFRRQGGNVGGHVGFSLVGSEVGDTGEFSIDAINIPEPSSVVLFAMGMLVWGVLGRYRSRKRGG